MGVAVNHYLCPAGLAWGSFLDRAQAHGYSGVGVTAAALREVPATCMREDLQRRGMTATSVNTAGFFLHADFDRVQAPVNARLLRDAAELGAPLNVIVGGSDGMPLADARARATDGLRTLARQAQALGVALVVEPLHPLQARGKSCFNTLAQVEAVFGAIPGLRLNADLFHLWWDPDLERLLRGDGVPIGLLQVCDVAIADPASPLPRRVPLGEGFLDWSRCVRTVQRAFPAAAVELELFADQLPGRALDELLRTNASALNDFLGERHGLRDDG